jgi:hypothetical protein
MNRIKLSQQPQHIHDCVSRANNEQVLENFDRQLPERCLWDQCLSDFKKYKPQSVTRRRKTVYEHLRRAHREKSLCLWENCGKECETETKLREHVQQCHQVNVRSLPYFPQFCFQHPASAPHIVIEVHQSRQREYGRSLKGYTKEI